MQSNVETGLQLITRLRKMPCVSMFDDTLFFNGLQNTDTVEITGNASSAKSLLLTKLLAKCILPDWHEGVHIKGLAASAVLINTDFHFQISKLIQVMSAIVAEAYESVDAKRINKEILNKIVNDVLDNLIIINCYENDQFLLTLHTLENILFRHEKIAILAIDSISAYYWQNRKSKGIWSIDLYVKSLIKIVHPITSQFNVITIYTKPSNSLSIIDLMKSVTNNITGELNYIIHLVRNTNSEKHLCFVQSMNGTKTISYMINAGLVKWINEGDQLD